MCTSTAIQPAAQGAQTNAEAQAVLPQNERPQRRVPAEIIGRIASFSTSTGAIKTLSEVTLPSNVHTWSGAVDLLPQTVLSPDAESRIGREAAVVLQMDFYSAAKRAGKENLAQQILARNPQLITQENVRKAFDLAVDRNLIRRAEYLVQNAEFNHFLAMDVRLLWASLTLIENHKVLADVILVMLAASLIFSIYSSL